MVPLQNEPIPPGRRGFAILASQVGSGLGTTVGLHSLFSFQFAPRRCLRTWGLFFRFGLQVLGAGVAFLTMPGHLGVYAAESLSAASAPESA